MTTIVSQNGYKIIKKDYSSKMIKSIKDELTVKPFVPPNSIQQPKSFQIFRESPKKLYVPRFYGINKYGLVVSFQYGSNVGISDIPLDMSVLILVQPVKAENPAYPISLTD